MSSAETATCTDSVDHSRIDKACLELPVEGGDEEADELVVRVRGAVRHERLQEVVDVVVAPFTKVNISQVMSVPILLTSRRVQVQHDEPVKEHCVALTEPNLEQRRIDRGLGSLLADLGDHGLLDGLEARYLLVEGEVLDLQ
jgi:hypothetical protein